MPEKISGNDDNNKGAEDEKSNQNSNGMPENFNSGFEAYLKEQQMQSQYAEYAKFLDDKKEKTNEKKPDAGGYERLKQQDLDKETKLNEQLKIEKYLNFNNGFNSVISDNSKMFDFDSEKMRQGAVNLKGEELASELGKIATKDFFSKEENIELLSDSDKDYVKNSIVGVNDRMIDANKSWEIMLRAMNTASKQDVNRIYKSSNKNEKDTTPSVTAYIESCLLKQKKVTA